MKKRWASGIGLWTLFIFSSVAQAAVSVNHLTGDFSDVQQSSYLTASVTPVANQPTLVSVGARKATATTQPTISGCNITNWTLVNSVVEFATGRSIYVFLGFDAAPTTGQITIDYGSNHLSAYWFVDGLAVASTSGTVVQSVPNSAFAQALTVTLATFTSVNNATYAVTFLNAATAITEGSGFTEIAELTGVLAFEAQFKATNDTTADWTYAGGTNKNVAGIAIEVKAATAGAGTIISATAQRRRRI